MMRWSMANDQCQQQPQLHTLKDHEKLADLRRDFLNTSSATNTVFVGMEDLRENPKKSEI